MNCRIDHYRIGHPILVVDIADHGWYCSHWGLTDLYEECEKNLRDLLKTGVDFETEWCGSKKELLSARYRRVDGKVWVDVNQWLDDLWDEGDLIDDAVWDVFDHREDIDIPDEGYRYIREVAAECDIDDSITISEDLGKDATFEDCMKAVERLMDATDNELNIMYERLKNIVRDYVTSEGLDTRGDG